MFEDGGWEVCAPTSTAWMLSLVCLPYAYQRGIIGDMELELHLTSWPFFTWKVTDFMISELHSNLGAGTQSLRKHPSMEFLVTSPLIPSKIPTLSSLGHYIYSLANLTIWMNTLNLESLVHYQYTLKGWKRSVCPRGAQVKGLVSVKTWFDAFYDEAWDLDLIFLSIFNTFGGKFFYRVAFIHL